MAMGAEMRLSFGLVVCLGVLASAARADVPRVVVDIAPVFSLVSQVMEDVGAPQLLVPVNASPHGYAMRPSEARALAQADLVVWIGPALSPWMKGPIETLATGAVTMTLLDQPETYRLPYRAGDGFGAHDHSHGHSHSHDSGHSNGQVVDDAVDGHAWLDPHNGMAWLRIIAEKLAEMDPENAARYRSNAMSAIGSLEQLEADIAARLAPVKEVPFVVMHDAYHYFEDHFGIEASAAITLSDEAAPSAARLAEVRAQIERSGARCVFAEPGENAGLVDAVAAGVPVRLVEMSPLFTDGSLGPDTYGNILTNMARLMQECLSEGS